MPDRDRAVGEGRQGLAERLRPGVEVRVVFTRHLRVLDLMRVAELAGEARDELVVPLIVGSLATPLDEQDLP